MKSKKKDKREVRGGYPAGVPSLDPPPKKGDKKPKWNG